MKRVIDANRFRENSTNDAKKTKIPILSAQSGESPVSPIWSKLYGLHIFEPWFTSFSRNNYKMDHKKHRFDKRQIATGNCFPQNNGFSARNNRITYSSLLREFIVRGQDEHPETRT